MYIPNISGHFSCGQYDPPLTDEEREESLDIVALEDQIDCLYAREFRPLYMDPLCSCPECFFYVWARMVYHANNLHKKVLWNDIIKRWEPTEFDQNFTEDFDTISNYEFRTYKSIFEVEIDAVSPICDTNDIGKHPMNEVPQGSGFGNAHNGYSTPDDDNACA